MFWADRVVEEITKEYGEKIAAGKPLVIRDEKTASGRVHIGSLRGVAIHGIIAEILSEKGIANRYLYEINDFDPMDGLPSYLEREKFLPHMGKPLYTIPSPDGEAKNYAEYFAQEFIGVITEFGFAPEFYRLSEQYKTGKFNDVIRLALQNADQIRAIYKKVSGSVKGEDWMPLQVICERCGKIGTTKISSFDGERVTYTCEEKLVSWARGCGHKGNTSPFDGNAKLPWKVEWAAKFKVIGVDIEGAGKDHSTKGGSREIAAAICRDVFDHIPPLNIPYEFLLVEGRKMSSSKGAGASSREIADALPHELLRSLLLLKDPRRVIDFVPDGDTIPVLFDTYDKLAQAYFENTSGDNPRIFVLMHSPAERKKITRRFLPRFLQIAFLTQMPHMNIEEEVTKMKGSPLTDEDKKEITHRVAIARRWLSLYAPEEYKYELQEESVPEAAKNFSAEQKKALALLLEYIAMQNTLDGQALHTKLHEIKTDIGIAPQDFFSAIYQSFLGKDSGPKAGWFLSVLEKKFLEKRLKEVS